VGKAPAAKSFLCSRQMISPAVKNRVSTSNVVVVVVLTSPSGNASMGGQIPQRDEDFHVFLKVDESRVSVSPSWCLTAILLIRGTT